MAACLYLAMTGAEFSNAQPLPARLGWMACHFSPYGAGLTNLPPALPSGSLLMVNDWLPCRDHDPERIAAQLEAAVTSLQCAGVVLDFQRQAEADLTALAALLVQRLPCPVAVPESYAEALDCPIFLSPCPHHTHLAEHLGPWTGREIWLDLAVDGETITLTREGARILPLPLGELPQSGHWEQTLHCHYSIETNMDSARFTLWRAKEDLEALAQEAKNLGVQTMVGLYQEWHRL